MKSLSGYVESITFRNEENGYTVLTLSYGKKEIKCTVILDIFQKVNI